MAEALLARPPLLFYGHAVPDPFPTPVTPYFFTLAGENAALEILLQRPHAWFVETGNRFTLESTVNYMLRAKPDFALSLTTVNAYRHPLASLLLDAIMQRFHLAQDYSTRVQTCLHETLLNAIVHGNLMLEHGFNSLTGFAEHYDQIEQRLSAEPYCSRRLHTCVWKRDAQLHIAITDEGDGIPHHIALTDTALPHGRGLHLIRTLADSLWISPDRRTVNMRFNG